MEFNEDVYSNSYRIWKDCIYHYCAYIELSKNFDHLKGDKEFWVYTCDAHFQMIVVRWCMIFGSYSNETHWKKLKLDEKEFSEYLLKELQISLAEWYIYWVKMKNFRDEYIAHRSLNSTPTPPFFDNAIKALLCLDSWVREKLQHNVFNEDTVYINGIQPLSGIMKSIKVDIKRSVSLITNYPSK